jgi:3-hydroxyisobutyrate dehydrogenase
MAVSGGPRATLMTRSVAVIGVGAMGAPIARRIQAAGLKLTVCDRNPDVLASFARSGAKVAQKPSDCADSDVIIILVATLEQMWEVIFGQHGLGLILEPERPPIVLVTSTVPVNAFLEVRERLRSIGVRVIDTPISGGAVRAENGTLTIMMGGETADLDDVRPVLASFGNQLFHCGPAGSALTMKIVNNIICAANTVLTAEAYRLAVENGLNLTDTARVLDVSTGRNFLSADHAGVAAAFRAMAPNRDTFDALLSILQKDVSLAFDMASLSGGAYPAIQGLMTIINSLGDETFRNWRYMSEAQSYPDAQ